MLTDRIRNGNGRKANLNVSIIRDKALVKLHTKDHANRAFIIFELYALIWFDAAMLMLGRGFFLSFCPFRVIFLVDVKKSKVSFFKRRQWESEAR